MKYRGIDDRIHKVYTRPPPPADNSLGVGVPHTFQARLLRLTADVWVPGMAALLATNPRENVR